MYLSTQEFIYLTLAIALGAIFTRFLPFIVFAGKNDLPKLVKYLGKTITPATMGFLVVYCLRNTQINTESCIIPEFVAILVLVIIHKIKRNLLLSITLSTLVYMFLVQQVS